jgi:hypothetical protein
VGGRKADPRGDEVMSSESSSMKFRLVGKILSTALVMMCVGVSFAHAAPKTTGPTTAPTTKPEIPKGAFELTEWVVFVVDPNRPNANDAAAFKSTLPGFARGRRSAAPNAGAMKNPSPVGVIRLKGGAEEDPIDVLLQMTAGRFLGYYPQGKPRDKRQLWEKVSLKEGKRKATPVDAGHWFETLRKGDASSTLSSGRWTEKFLMYDAEVSYPNALQLKAAEKGGTGAYQVANAGFSMMRDVEFYAPAQGGGWRVMGLAALPGSRPPPPVKPPTTTQPSTKRTSDVNAVFTDATTQPATKPAVTATTMPTTQPLAKTAWKDVRIPSDVKPVQATDAVAGWKSRLANAGLPDVDVEVILATLRTHALDPEELTAVYRMEQPELDRLLPLEVVPLPAKTTRVGIAIVKNIDPAAGERIAKLIAQLGSPNWDEREKAEAKLAELGAGAKPKLDEALKNSDLEIVYRAERLVEKLKPQ